MNKCGLKNVEGRIEETVTRASEHAHGLMYVGVGTQRSCVCVCVCVWVGGCVCARGRGTALLMCGCSLLMCGCCESESDFGWARYRVIQRDAG